jgi:PBP1b-binding outer membrane lipoprotein LpoB
MRNLLLYLALIVAGCSDNVETATYNNESDTTAKTLNKSEIINDSSQLPKDSSATGVQH